MKKTLLIAGALLALTASIASAQGGINLSWGDCGTFGTAQKNFNCLSSTGANILIASAIAPVPMDQLNGMAGVIDIQTNQAALSPWWGLASGGCRAASLSASFGFASGPFNCMDIWGTALGGASGGVNASVTAPNRVRIKTVAAIAGSTPADNVSEMYMFQVIINNAKSTGTGSCAGCTDGACIVLNSILLTQPAGVGDFTLTGPITRQHALWQGGAANVTGGCPQATPTRTSTWGSVKSLYR